MIERKAGEFEDDRKKWKIYFDFEDSNHNRGNATILVRFMMERGEYLTDKDIEKLKQDLKDLGKFRIIKQGKQFLEK